MIVFTEYITGTLPIVVDMNYIPKLVSEEENELPPPLPPRELLPPFSSEEPPAPALPPKPGQVCTSYSLLLF